ncbi:hypothetical protein Tco_0633265, partial [Tanacetum coccineum]
MADHSQKWHDGSSNRNIDSSINTEGIVSIVSKLDTLGQDIKKLKENVHAIQVGCQTCGGPHLDKECPLNEEVKSIEELKYSEFGRSSPFNNGAKYRVGLPGYYTRKETLGKQKINTRNQSASLKNLETQIEQLTKEFQAKTANEVPNSSVDKFKAVYANDEALIDNTSSNETNEVSFISNNKAQEAQEEDDFTTKVLPCQLPPKELNPISFTLPCTIGSLNF